MMCESNLSFSSRYAIVNGKATTSICLKYHVLTETIGILTMHLDKETFERAGIPGRSPNANTCSTGQARRGESALQLVFCHFPNNMDSANHTTPTPVISVDLKNLASPQEKRVYERLVHACESLFIEKLGWLICLDTGSSKTSGNSFRS